MLQFVINVLLIVNVSFAFKFPIFVLLILVSIMLMLIIFEMQLSISFLNEFLIVLKKFFLNIVMLNDVIIH